MNIEYFDSVWDAIEPNKMEAANMKARADLMIAIQETVKGWHETQVVSAKRLGLTQPRLNDLLRGRTTRHWRVIRSGSKWNGLRLKAVIASRINDTRLIRKLLQAF
jgi:predicted XRE-type DNA-binding protein